MKKSVRKSLIGQKVSDKESFPRPNRILELYNPLD